jgi:SAM-dependent methyltransferase
MSIDEGKLQEFMGKAVTDLAASASIFLSHIGDRLGLYKALAAGPLTPAELAAKTGTNERYIREWLGNQAAGGYVQYDAATKKYSMTPEQAFALAEENSPVFLGGAFQIMNAFAAAVPRTTENFKTGAGIPWGEHHHDLFEGVERFFRPNYAGNLVSSWIPSLEGVEAKLKAGASVADVGCGYGASTVLMAQAYPKSRFVGFDFHPPSIEAARQRAQAAGVADRVRFDVARSTDYPGKGYDLVAHFDCLHDMGDPVSAAHHVRETLAPGGTWMLVEPMAGDNVEANLHPVGRLFYAASTLVCVPTSLAQQGIALGAQAGEARLRQVLTQGGFTKIRRATETPFNLVIEARA